MNFFKQLCIFQTNQAFKDAVGVSVYPAKSPQDGLSIPSYSSDNYAVFNLISDDHILSHQGVSNIGECIVQYDFYSNVFSDIQSVPMNLIDLYEGIKQDIGNNYEINYCKLETDLQQNNQDLDLVYRRTLDFTFRYRLSAV